MYMQYNAMNNYLYMYVYGGHRIYIQNVLAIITLITRIIGIIFQNSVLHD